MSLIVATSRIDENTLPQPSERPGNFKNFFRSPIEIETNSEIAVQSVKIQRTGNITIEEDDFFCHYFGTDPRNYDTYADLTSLSRTIKIPRGTYSLVGYEKAVQDALNVQYDDPRTFGGYGVDINTDGKGAELGLDIQCVDKGSAAGKDLHASMEAVGTFNISHPSAFFENNVIEPSTAFTWNIATGEFTSTYSSTRLNESKSVGMLYGYPFGLNGGAWTTELVNCSEEPFCVGLSRPQIQIESPTNQAEAQTIVERHDGIHNLDHTTRVLMESDTNIATYDGARSIEGPYEMYDYVFILDEDDEITIAQRVYSPAGDFSYMQEIEYWKNAYGNSPGTIKLTKAQFYATWDGIEFRGVGDEVELWFKQKGVGFEKVVSSTFAAEISFSPIGTTSYALYPQLNICKGNCKITKMESSNTLNQYKYPVFTAGLNGGYVPGDDAFSNESFFALNAEPWIRIPAARTLCSNSLQSLVLQADGSDQKYENFNEQYFFELLNSANGVDYVHLFTMNKFTQPNRDDTLMKSQEFPNMSGRLGFKDRAFIISNNTDGYVVGNDSLTVIFTSTGDLDKTSTSSFLRIPNLTHKTFNGAQSGLSKIIYQLPQFSNDGRQFGPLYFEASEKTYVKLHNTSPMILNMLQIQIVDAQERELNSLTGDTQIVFHIRKCPP